MPDESVGALAELYLGNILYALELAALSLESQGKDEDAAGLGIGDGQERMNAQQQCRAKPDDD